ncbi:hypothetical protein NQ314_015928 [Rhamnusium bicolor]|uniref:DDE Tnp4 domain-containing protein n=1 Tax=Rhamnusium bicolor TaxID=1586634 RepID=A0AAV8WX43_9CUCU|nr:hypothetical protein NQ314_015928 [Rhamnusium bicolor]
MSAKRVNLIIKEHSRFYLGLPEDAYFLVKLLESEAEISHTNIFIILKKIRLNDLYYRLAVDFGLPTASMSRVNKNHLSKLASYFKTLIFWPEANKINLNLPLPFHYRYSKVQSIIDCLEIEIEQPSNSVHQALTWSNYKKTNTLKYLISPTPDDIINFISEGFGGRITDKEIVEASNYLNILPPNCDVMADRGFKGIGGLLNKKNCNLIRPPSVQTGTQCTKQEVKESKRIASLRIHIERVIRRLREFCNTR